VPTQPREYLVVVSCRRISPQGDWQELTRFLVSATSAKAARHLATATTPGLDRAVWHRAKFRFSIELLDLHLERLRCLHAALINPLHEPRPVEGIIRPH